MGKYLTPTEVLDYEDKYGPIYVIEILEHTFYFRDITTKELEQANRLFENEEDRSEYICGKCVIHPIGFDFANCYAGITYTLYESILSQSGYDDGYGKLALNYHRNQMNKFENQISSIICTAFPALNIEEVEQWTLNKQVSFLAKAEWVLVTLKGVPIEIGEEKEPEIDYDAFPELRNRKQYQKRGF